MNDDTLRQACEALLNAIDHEPRTNDGDYISSANVESLVMAFAKAQRAAGMRQIIEAGEREAHGLASQHLGGELLAVRMILEAQRAKELEA